MGTKSHLILPPVIRKIHSAQKDLSETHEPCCGPFITSCHAWVRAGRKTQSVLTELQPLDGGANCFCVCERAWMSMLNSHLKCYFCTMLFKHTSSELKYSSGQNDLRPQRTNEHLNMWGNLPKKDIKSRSCTCCTAFWQIMLFWEH